ncbi:hypothetical protein HDU76_009718 [Blyttiomyces sp. JEL0837]|nr:hypothetical protein HDU76_009718 [Blyttiomyces sp. JEL0837]
MKSLTEVSLAPNLQRTLLIANTSQDTLDIDEDELAAALLEKEAFGEKREILELADDDILTRHYRGACDDLDLFDEVVAYKKTWPDGTFEQALERFGECFASLVLAK